MERTQDIKLKLENAMRESREETENLIHCYEEDPRKAVQSLLSSFRKKLAALEAETARVEAMLAFERQYPDCDFICGIDEVGRGPLAGPVAAGAVILPKDCRILYVNDSKKLSPKKREELDAVIRREAVAFAVGEADAKTIDEINILQATYLAMRRAIQALPVTPSVLLNDAVRIPGVDIAQVPIIKGDAKSLSIASASIIAKVYRDHRMEEYDAVYPGYGFAENKGYGTAAHMEALRKAGPCPIHRRSFLSGLEFPV